MNKTALALALAATLGLSACSSFSPGKSGGLNPPSDSQVAIKDTQISTEFTGPGIKIFYTLMGNVDRIEVYGRAPAWKGNPNILAEHDAKVKLLKFVHGESVSSEQKVRIIGKAIDKARDNTLQNFKTNDGTLNFTDRELETAITDGESTRDNTSSRITNRIDNTIVNVTNTVRSQGRLTGLIEEESQVVDNGRVLQVKFVWSEKTQATSEFIRGKMR